jgi:hypothetical protein
MQRLMVQAIFSTSHSVMTRPIRRSTCTRIRNRYIAIFSLFLLVVVAASNEFDDLVQKIVSEDQYHDSDHFESKTETVLEEQEIMDEVLRQQNRINKKIQEREDSFARELAWLKEDEAAIQKLLKQKKKDAKIVNRVLQSFHAGNYYAALGIHRTAFVFGTSRIRIRKLSIPLIPNYFTLNLPEFEFFGGVSEQRIKKAYRDMAKRVHPDKNRDPRAVEAFHMVEKAASVLLDASSREEYDRQWQEQRRLRRIKLTHRILRGFEKGTRIAGTIVTSAKKLLGPFTVPVVILVALIA